MGLTVDTFRSGEGVYDVAPSSDEERITRLLSKTNPVTNGGHGLGGFESPVKEKNKMVYLPFNPNSPPSSKKNNSSMKLRSPHRSNAPIMSE